LEKKTGDGIWEMGDGRWEMGDGRQETEDGVRSPNLVLELFHKIRVENARTEQTSPTEQNEERDRFSIILHRVKEQPITSHPRRHNNNTQHKA
jgi:hypothetical protein